MTKLNNDIVRQALARKNDPEFIYKMHMAQARSSQKMFADNPEALARIDAIIVKIKKTYADSQREVA
jgi:hypothetical protein